MQKRWEIKLISAKENDRDNVSLTGVQGLKGMSHEHKSLTTTILRKSLKCIKKYLQLQLLLFLKKYIFLEKFLLRSFLNILKKGPLYIYFLKEFQCGKDYFF